MRARVRDRRATPCYVLLSMAARRRPLGKRRAGRPFLAGHLVELLVDGGPYYRRVLEAIESAQRYVYVETYIWRADETGQKVADALMAKARAGVEVAVCYDGFGSGDLPKAFEEALDAAGVKRLVFRPVSLWRSSWPWSRRNHRKILAVDGRVGIVGGLNFGNEYAAVSEGGDGWRDTAVRIEGPAVSQLDLLFRYLWSKEGGAPLRSEPQRTGPWPGGIEVRFLANFARGERALVRRAYLVAIRSARTRIQIMNAYFFPDRTLRRALVEAARRGVQVEIIVAVNSDVRAAVYAAQSLYGRFLQAGIRIFEWHERVLHAKTAVVDDEWTTVGSTNLDYFSSYVNLEVNAGIFSRSFGRHVSDQFARDRARCREVVLADWKARSWWRRVLELGFRWVTKRY